MVASRFDPIADLARRTSDAAARFDPAVVEHAAVLLLDHLGCAAAGPDPAAPWEQGVVERAAHQALAGQWVDLDDVHWAGQVHPGAIVWPTIMNVGDRAPGQRWLHAGVVGYAVIVSIARSASPDHLRRFHVTATAGAIGAAATAAALLGLDAPTTAAALRHALSSAGGSRGALRDRSRATRAVHRAHAVRTGLGAVAAALAGASATSTAEILTGGAFDEASFAPRPAPGRRSPIEAGPLLATQLRLVPGEPAALPGREALGVKYALSPADVAARVAELAARLSDTARLARGPVLGTMAGLRPVDAAPTGGGDGRA